MKVMRAHFRDQRGRMCNKGLRDWIKRHGEGLTYQDFLKFGIDHEVLLRSGDQRVNGVIENARSDDG